MSEEEELKPYSEVIPAMINKKHLTLLFCVALFTLIAFQAQPAEALPFDGEYTNETITAGNWYKVWDTMDTGDEITGYFETHAETQGLKFFICDSANLIDWEGGFSATVYELQSDMHTLGFSFTVPNDDTWTCVFSNEGSTSVTVDIGVDINDDNTPFYSASSYTDTGYGIVLENDEYYYLYDTFQAGTEIDGHFSTFFPTDGLDFFICDQENFDLWVADDPATGFSIETDMYQSSIDRFTVPTAGVWYCVFVAADEVDTVTFSFGIDIDTSGVTDSGGGMSLTGIGVVAAVFISLIICCVCRSKKKQDPGPPPTMDRYVAPPSQPPVSSTIREREVTTRVLVVCPYCGSKNEQGILSCTNCDAEL
ncbi:MAG: hypothetical protein ACTSWA_07455 [Candidatus Thorarchaeota archaeon]